MSALTKASNYIYNNLSPVARVAVNIRAGSIIGVSNQTYVKYCDGPKRNLHSQCIKYSPSLSTSVINTDHRNHGLFSLSVSGPDQSLINYTQVRGRARLFKLLQRKKEAKLAKAKRILAEAQKPKTIKSHVKGVKVDKFLMRFLSDREADKTLPEPPQDDVYFSQNYRRPRYPFEEVIKFHRQYAQVAGQPDALLSAIIDLNVKMKIKKKKYIEKIASTVCYPNLFNYAVRPRKIVALCKSEKDQEAAREAGASCSGGLDIIQLLKTNQLTQRDFDHIVCHADIIVDFANAKGMKAQPYFPTKQRGNFGENIVELVRYFKDGVDYSLTKTDDDPSFGYISCYFGRVDMTDEQLRENLVELFNSINRFKPLNLADNKQFFERVIITSAASEEAFLLRFWDLIDDYVDPDTISAEEGEQAVKQ